MPWYTIPEAAAELEVATSTLRGWVMEQGCPSAIGPDSRRIVSLEAVELWMADREAEAEAEEDEDDGLEDEADEDLEDEDGDDPDDDSDSDSESEEEEEPEDDDSEDD